MAQESFKTVITSFFVLLGSYEKIKQDRLYISAVLLLLSE